MPDEFSVELEGVDEALKALDNVLGGLEQGRILMAGMRKIGNAVNKEARKFIRKPGYPGDLPDKRPLRKTLGVRLYESQGNITGYARPLYKLGGQHGHNVEFGHDIRIGKDGPVVGRTKPVDYMQRGIDVATPRLQQILDDSVGPQIQKLFVKD